MQAAADRHHGTGIDAFEGHQVLHAAVPFHIIQIHRHQLQHAPAPLQGICQHAGQRVGRKRALLCHLRFQITDPRLIFPLQQSQEDLLFGLKIIIDRRACKGCPLSDIPERDLLESHVLIQLRAGADDLFLSRGDQRIRSFRHSDSSFPDHYSHIPRKPSNGSRRKKNDKHRYFSIFIPNQPNTYYSAWDKY